jgi:hypothetical protein
LLLLCIGQRLCQRQWYSPKVYGGAAALACGGVIMLYGAGWLMAPAMHLHAAPGVVQIGQADKSSLIVLSGQGAVGTRYGHCLREALTERGGARVFMNGTQPQAACFANAERIIFAGGLPDACLREFSGEVVLLNPPIPSADELMAKLPDTGVRVVVGSIGNWQRRHWWQTECEERPKWVYEEVPGAAEFLPNWVDYLK